MLRCIWLSLGRSHEWIPDAQRRETGEVSVGGEKLAHPVIEADGGDAGVVESPANGAAVDDERAQRLEMGLRFVQRNGAGARKPVIDLGEGAIRRCWLSEDTRICDHGKELLQHWPAQAYLCRAAENVFRNLRSACVRRQV